MVEKEKVKLFLGRPKDRSFEAYKEFVRALSIHLGVPTEKRSSDEELRQSWLRFWKGK